MGGVGSVALGIFGAGLFAADGLRRIGSGAEHGGRNIRAGMENLGRAHQAGMIYLGDQISRGAHEIRIGLFYHGLPAAQVLREGLMSFAASAIFLGFAILAAFVPFIQQDIVYLRDIIKVHIVDGQQLIVIILLISVIYYQRVLKIELSMVKQRCVSNSQELSRIAQIQWALLPKNVATSTAGARFLCTNKVTIEGGGDFLSVIPYNHVLDTNPTYSVSAANIDHVIELADVFPLKHIRARFYATDKRHYRYTLEVSIDNDQWTNIHRDCSPTGTNCSCGECTTYDWTHHQFSEARNVKYIKFIGTYVPPNRRFAITYVEAIPDFDQLYTMRFGSIARAFADDCRQKNIYV